jgi:rhamnosyltransferase
MKISLIIPTLNGGELFKRVIRGLSKETLKPDILLIIDSGSIDDTIKVAMAAGAEIYNINKRDFNHGATRNLAISLAEADIYIFMTQDALPVGPDTLKNLVGAFDLSPEVGLVYARQLPRPDAGHIEAFSRFFTYPEVSHVKKRTDKARLGIKTVHCSNACAAYRGDVLAALGGFPENVIMCEDVYVAAKIISMGYQVAYAADAMVHHSHDYSVWQEFQRYFDNGVFYGSRERWITEEFGRTGSEGVKFFRNGCRYLKENGQAKLIPEWFFRMCAKFCAYHLGARERYLPLPLKQQLSMHKAYWQKS